MVDLAVIARFQAMGTGAAAVAGIADESLVGGGDPLLAAQIQRPAGVVVEHGQVVNCFGGHADQVRHRQSGTAAGSRGRGHRCRRVGYRVRGLVEFGQRGGGDHRNGLAAVQT
jgi:hypothetical protein